MPDPIQRLSRLDARRRRLDAYIARVTMAFWMPSLQKRILNRLHQKLRQTSTERARVLAHITADPALRQRLRDTESGQLAPAASNPPPKDRPRLSDSINQRQADIATEQQRMADILKGKAAATLPRPIPDQFRDQALNVAGLKSLERLAKDGYQDAVWYYKSGDWKQHDIPVEHVTGLLDTLKQDMQLAIKNRVTTQQSFEDGLRQAFPGDPHHIAYREELLATAPAPDLPSIHHNAFHRWAEENIPRDRGEQSQGPQKLRRRGL